MQYRHTQFDETVNVTQRHPLREFITYSTALCLVIGLVFYLSVHLVEWLIPHIDPKTEIWLWNTVLKDEFLTGGKPLNDEQKAMQQRMQRLVDAMTARRMPGREYTVILMPDDEINAYALPSGKIVVTTGLLKNLKSENGMAFVLGHELGHFANRDHLRGMGRALITGMLLSPILSDDSSLSALFGKVGSGFDSHFSREQETAADAVGLELLAGQYGHAGGATEFFDYLQREKMEESVIEYLSTHPLSATRKRQLERLIAERGIPAHPAAARD